MSGWNRVKIRVIVRFKMERQQKRWRGSSRLRPPQPARPMETLGQADLQRRLIHKQPGAGELYATALVDGHCNAGVVGATHGGRACARQRVGGASVSDTSTRFSCIWIRTSGAKRAEIGANRRGSCVQNRAPQGREWCYSNRSAPRAQHEVEGAVVERPLRLLRIEAAGVGLREHQLAPGPGGAREARQDDLDVPAGQHGDGAGEVEPQADRGARRG